MSFVDPHGNIHRAGGNPGGGQFTGHVRTAPEGVLIEPTDQIVDRLRERRRELLEAGYVPALAGPSAGTAPHSTAGIGDWWGEHYSRAEVRNGSGFHQMPDDYTPSSGSGKALSGKRRTHRILYTGGGIALRMPSATAIKRFSAEINDDTFDVPVQAEGHGGIVVSGYVRVTRSSGGSWAVSSLNMPPTPGAKISEAVAAVLEARRPTLALREAGDLLARRRERLAQVGVRVSEIDNSSWVKALGYNSHSGEMVITLGSRTYAYKVSADVYQRVLTSWSAGTMYNRLVKGSERVEVDQCSECSRWFNTETGHKCLGHRPASATVKPYAERVRTHLLASSR